MANTRELRRRIKSVKNTAQITKAMQMVAATKMRRAQNQAISGRPYSQTLSSALGKILPKIEAGLHPLLQKNDSGKTGILLLTTDKGLCGALNTNIFRVTSQFLQSNDKTVFYTIGKKGRGFCVRINKELIADFENSEVVSFKTASQIGKLLIDGFLAKDLKEVFLIYPDFVSALRQEPKVVKLLPLDLEAVKSFTMDLIETDKKTKENVKDSEVLFEPALNELLEYVLTHFVQTKIYQALLELKASEHSARMMAMQNATDNAKELVGDLTLAYNQTRQEGITKELLEITSALSALE